MDASVEMSPASDASSLGPISVFIGSHLRPTVVEMALDTTSGKLERVSQTDTAMFPRGLAWNAQTRVLLATADRQSRIQALRREHAGGFTSLGAGVTTIPGAWPVDLALHPSGRWLLVGHYENSSQKALALVGLDSAGVPSGERFVSPDACDDTGTFRVAFDPSGRYAFAVCDDDGVRAYRIDLDDGALIPVVNDRFRYVSFTDLTFSRARDVAYLSDDTRLSVYSYDAETGMLAWPAKQNVVFSLSGVPVGFPGRSLGAWFAPSLVWNAAGDVLYALNTIEDAISIMAVAPDGTLTPIDHVEGIRKPVAAAMSPGAPWLLVVSETDGTVAVFRSRGLALEMVGAPAHAVEGAASLQIAPP